MSAEKRLVVISPGLGLRTAGWAPLLKRLRREPEWDEENTEIFLYETATKPWGLKRLQKLGLELCAHLDAKWIESDGFHEILLVGHSLGGLVVREAFLQGRGTDAKKEPIRRWAGAVSRIVLLAAPNRGIANLTFVGKIADWFLRRIPLLPTLTYEDLLRGSAFITNLRIGWIRLFQGAPPTARLPKVVQLLGTDDSVVDRDDSIDVLAFPNGALVDVPGAGHDEVYRLERLPADEADERYALLRAAILHPEKLSTVTPPALSDRPEPAKHVVFILHGIRASNVDRWLLALEEEVRDKYPPGTVIERPTYGYLTARQFALPYARRRFVPRLQDAYTESLARNPQAEFDFIGHSNGTYLLGESLRMIPSMKFRNVVLAGSVLPQEYRWNEKLGAQVRRLRSDRGMGDWPVGWLCSALSKGLGMRDVGTGGYTGFTRGRVQQEPHHPGGHGGMFSEGNIPRMVRFAMGLEPGELLPEQGDDKESFGVFSRLIPRLLHFLFLILLGGGAYFAATAAWGSLGIYVATLAIIGLVLYILLDVI